MKQYQELGDIIIKNGRYKPNRTGVGTYGIFGAQFRFNLQEGFPLVTTKETIFKPMIAELIWFLEGSTNNERLRELGAKFWDQWALTKPVHSTESVDIIDAIHKYAVSEGITYSDAFNKLKADSDYNDRDKGIGFVLPALERAGIKTKPLYDVGELGPIYGAQWRNFNGVDQISNLIKDLKDKPFSRRHIVSAWNPNDLADDSISPEANIENGKMALSPCHCLFQFGVEEGLFDERMKHFESLFHYDIIVDEEVLKNRIFASKFAKEFVEFESLYTQENKECLPFEEVITFAKNKGISITIYKALEVETEKIKLTFTTLSPEKFLDFKSKHVAILEKSSSHISTSEELAKLYESFSIPKCIDDVIKSEDLINKSPSEMRIYCNKIFDDYNIPKLRLNCQLYQR